MHTGNLTRVLWKIQTPTVSPPHQQARYKELKSTPGLLGTTSGSRGHAVPVRSRTNNVLKPVHVIRNITNPHTFCSAAEGSPN